MTAEAWGAVGVIYAAITVIVLLISVPCLAGTSNDRKVGARVIILAPVWIIWPFYGLFLALRALWRAAEWKSNGTAS